ncbi:DUF4286 family protein [Rhabdobacter roseus]|uniref:DUF4286 family protein n=1 Tax=Rhabdobacter roseus TaxID=1655419 RepID=A0A840TZN4_9BACT|nr:DUF4286 family protein [Rhabdobacter roseus]MBB5285099.1 hypothetical protein [Rhabdobacter roseus]
MILYNITTSILHEAEQEWLHWMKSEHIPEAMATGLPAENRLLRLLTELDNGGVTYTCQYYFNTLAEYELYLALHEPQLQRKHNQRYRNRAASFHTLLEDV